METPRESTAALDDDPDADLQQVSAALQKQSEIVGLKYFDQLRPLLGRLQDDGCLRDRAGIRELHYDQYCLLVLLFLFNPTCSSLRAIQQASQLQNVQKRLGSSKPRSRQHGGQRVEGCGRFCRRLWTVYQAELSAGVGSRRTDPEAVSA